MGAYRPRVQRGALVSYGLCMRAGQRLLKGVDPGLKQVPRTKEKGCGDTVGRKDIFLSGAKHKMAMHHIRTGKQ